MRPSYFLIACVFLFSAATLAEQQAEAVPSLERLLNHTTRHIHHAKGHTEHMLTINVTEEAKQKISDIAKNACDHFSTELETQGTEIQSKASGQHKAELTAAANNAATQFKSASATLKGISGSDLKQRNTEYFNAAEVVLQESKKLIDAGPCEEIEPIIRQTLNELIKDCDDYQDKFHAAVGAHPPPADGGHGAHGHHHHHGDGHHHHAHPEGHQHHHHEGQDSSASSEEGH